MNELNALLILNALPISNKRVFALVQHFGSARAVLDQPVDDWCVSERAQSLIERFDRDAFLKQEFALMDQHDVDVMTYFDPLYPAALKEIPDAPMVLYIKGRIPDCSQAIGIVGSRRASLYGLDHARQFARRLAERGVPVISGFARGIDTAAHRGCLDADGVTIAVLGSGIGCIYPAENKRWVEKVCARGALISEFAMTTEPYPYNFPRRNRIVSGLSKGILVVEAAKRSGALITADFALEQGRDVYCLPGPVDSPASQGVHHLIQQGGKLVMCVEDILDTPLVSTMPKKNAARKPKDLSEAEVELLDQLTKDPKHIDELGASASSILLKLQMKNLIRELPGKHYVSK